MQTNRCLTSCGEAPQSTDVACSPEIDGSVLTVVMRECIVDHGLQLWNLWSSSPDCDVVSIANRLDRWSRPWHISYVIVKQGK